MADRGVMELWVRAGRVHPSSWGVRVRSTLASMAVLGVALAVVAGGLLWLLRSSLESSADTTAATRAEQVAAQLGSDAPSTQDTALVAATGVTSFVQVYDTTGAVVLASPGAPAQALAAPLPDAATSTSGSVDIAGEPGDYRIAARGVTGPGGALTVAVAIGNEPIVETLTLVAVLLGLGLPVVMVVAGFSTWVLVGRSLRSVERMRSRAEVVSTADLGARLPVPRPRDEISALAVTLNAMLGRLQAGHEAQRRFVGDASHELRSPLATVTAALELAQDHPEAIDRELVRANLLPEAHRMQRLVEDLLLLAKADEQGLGLRVGDVDLDDVAEAEAARLRRGGALTVTTDISPVRVRGDATALARVARNLADNAARHARGDVSVVCRTVPDGAQLVVSDDGPGIPAAERDRVFERFVRLDPDRARAAGGSGLGLAIVAEVVAAHHGTVTVGESPAGGAQVVITLPVGPPEHDHPGR